MAQPKLRFMREDGTSYPEWETLTLGDRFAFKNGINASREAFRTAGIHCIGVSDIIKCLPILADNVIGTVAISNDEIEKNKVNYGDILFQRSSETQEDIGHASVYIDKRPSVYNGFVICGKPDKLFYNPVFLHNSLQHSRVRKQTIALGAGAQHYNIGQESLAKINIIFPCLEEQQKIADFFSAIDGIIAQSEAEIQNLEQQKKAAMQKIFSQEVRFRRENGTEFPEWEEKTIGELGTVITGNTPPTKDKDNYDGDFLWVTPTDISGFPILYETERKLTEKGKAKARFLPKDTVLVTCIASIGKNCILSKEGSCNQQINAIIPFSFTNSYYLLNVINLKKHELEMLGGNGGMKIVSKSLFESFVVPIPCLEEQQKIADFLSIYDEAITYAKQELDKWKELKKGLLQQMFV